jgi:NTE family protein
VPGALIWAASFWWYLERVGSSPDFLGAWLPGQVLSGIGVGATLPVLGGAAVAALPKGGQYATAAAVVSSARQLGGVLGIALLVLLVGTPQPGQAEDVLRRGWVLAALCFVAVAAGAALLGRTSVTHAADDEDLPPLPQQLPPTPARARRRRPQTSSVPEVSNGLRDLPLFAGLSERALRRLQGSASDVDLHAGSYLFRAGDRSDAVYLVRGGRLEVERDGVVVSRLRRGAVIGELGLLTDERRSASVRAVRDSTLLRLGREQFLAVADTGVMTALAQVLAERLQRVAPAPLERERDGDVVVAVVGLDPGAPVRETTAALLAGLQRHVVADDPGRVDRHGLEQAERCCDRVLLTATADDDAWRSFCLRVADRVVVVSSRPDPPSALPCDRAAGADLVLAGPAASRAQRTAWEALLEPRSTHAVERVDVASMRPLADRVAGRSLGLVLGGGGARAFAHLGVLDELQAAGIVVDRVAGTSVGAAIAALHATGMDADAVDAHVYEYFVRRNPIGDYRLPAKGLIRGRITVAGLDAIFGDAVVEELPKEFRCLSVDLLARTPFVHRTGRVADAVACSLRLPGLYPPYLLDGRLHVDGGVLDNLPVSTLAGPEGPVVAVKIAFGGGGGGSTRRTPRVPALADTLTRTMMMASGDAAVEALARADVVVAPEATGVGLLEFHQIDVMREAGRRAAREALPAIEELVGRRPAHPARRPSARPKTSPPVRQRVSR